MQSWCKFLSIRSPDLKAVSHNHNPYKSAKAVKQAETIRKDPSSLHPHPLSHRQHGSKVQVKLENHALVLTHSCAQLNDNTLSTQARQELLETAEAAAGWRRCRRELRSTRAALAPRTLRRLHLKPLHSYGPQLRRLTSTEDKYACSVRCDAPVEAPDGAARHS